jgi:hypothetical protein
MGDELEIRQEVIYYPTCFKARFQLLKILWSYDLQQGLKEVGIQ